MKYGLFLLFFGALGFGVSQVPIDIPSPENKFNRAADTLKMAIDSTVALNKAKSEAVDSIQALTEYMQQLLTSHDYRVYKYTNPRQKLIYRWKKGIPGHWELLKTINY